MGLVDLATNASYTGSDPWSQIDPLVSSWLLGFRNSPIGAPNPSLFSIRYMEAGDPPGGFPNSRLAIMGNGNVGIQSDAPACALDVLGTYAPGDVGTVRFRSITGMCYVTIEAADWPSVQYRSNGQYMGEVACWNSNIRMYTGTNTTSGLCVTSTNTVGINTQSPVDRLTIVGSAGFGHLRFVEGDYGTF